MTAVPSFTFSDGATFRTMLDALVHLKLNPGLTVVDSRGDDATGRLRRLLTDHPYGKGK